MLGAALNLARFGTKCATKLVPIVPHLGAEHANERWRFPKVIWCMATLLRSIFQFGICTNELRRAPPGCGYCPPRRDAVLPGRALPLWAARIVVSGTVSRLGTPRGVLFLEFVAFAKHRKRAPSKRGKLAHMGVDREGA